MGVTFFVRLSISVGRITGTPNSGDAGPAWVGLPGSPWFGLACLAWRRCPNGCSPWWPHGLPVRSRGVPERLRVVQVAFSSAPNSTSRPEYSVRLLHNVTMVEGFVRMMQHSRRITRVCVHWSRGVFHSFFVLHIPSCTKRPDPSCGLSSARCVNHIGRDT